MTIFRTRTCALGLVSTAGMAVAQTAAPAGDPVDRASLSATDRMSMAFTSHVFDTLTSYEGMMNPTDILRLAIIAKQRAVAETCEGFTVDETRFNAAMQGAIGSLIDTETSEGGAITLPFMIAYSGYATLLGGNLALAAYDPDAMCAHGAQLREELSEEGGEALLIWADAG